MSFVVTFQGQFKPYQLPDFGEMIKVRPISRSNALKKLRDHEDDDFDNDPGASKQQSSSKKPALSAYQKNSGSSASSSRPLARDIMSSPVRFLNEDDPLEKAVGLIETFGYRHFPVLNAQDVLCGIISDRDTLEAKNLYPKAKIKEFMTKEALTALDDASVQDIARIMLYEKISCLPVINRDHVIVGIVTQSDILNMVVQSGRLNLTI